MSTTDPITPLEAAELRRRLDQVSPLRNAGMPADPPAPDPGSFQGQIAAKQEAKRQERIAAALAAHEKACADQAAAEEAERQRKARNAPRIAVLDKKILDLRVEYRRVLKPLDDQIEQLTKERRALQ